jgi:osmoprotectant transport system substrate-binding protein
MSRGPDRRRFLALAAASALAGGPAGCSPPHPGHPVIGAKNFTEQVLLGTLLIEQIRAQTHLQAEGRFYLAGSYIAHQALIAGRIDAYVEYAGTALSAILKQPLVAGAGEARRRVAGLYRERFGVEVMPSLGFSNSFALLVRPPDATRLGLRTLSDLAARGAEMRLGVGYEFEERPDGLPGLTAAYGMRFARSPIVMDLGLLYRALETRQVDVVAGNSTDGPIAALGLVRLEDDRHFFASYEALPLVRRQALERWPALAAVFAGLAGKLSEEAMRAMNEAVDSRHQDPAEVVRSFRATSGL